MRGGTGGVFGFRIYWETKKFTALGPYFGSRALLWHSGPAVALGPFFGARALLWLSGPSVALGPSWHSGPTVAHGPFSGSRAASSEGQPKRPASLCNGSLAFAPLEKP